MRYFFLYFSIIYLKYVTNRKELLVFASERMFLDVILSTVTDQIDSHMARQGTYLLKHVRHVSIKITSELAKSPGIN